MATWDPIPGETPIEDASGLIPRGIETRQQLNVVEAENIRKVVVRYLAAKPSKRQAPFTLRWLYKLHEQMFGEVWKWAGKRRSTELNIGVPAFRVEENLQQMLDDLQYWSTETQMEKLEQATRLHHRSVQIHPFLNGNGRWARMLANIWLKRNGFLVTVWPDDVIGEASIIREEYLRAIRAADGGDMGVLLALHKKYT